MRLLVLSASSGALYMYQNYERTDGDNADESVAFAVRLFDINKLLLQASRREIQPGDAATGSRQGGWIHGGSVADGGSTTILGVGMRRPNRPKPLASSEFQSRLAVRQWHLDSEQWHLAEDRDADVLLALSVPAGWDAGAAEYLTTSVRDAFIHAYRPQLMDLKAAAAANAGTAVASPPQLALRLPPGSVTTLLTRQALKHLCKLAQDAMDSMVSHGLHPCWLYVAHADSFMGAAPKPTGLGAGDSSGGGASSRGSAEGGGNRGEATDGAAPKKEKRTGKGKGFLKSFLGALRKGGTKKKAQEKQGCDTGAAATLGQASERLSRGPPGPIGHLQHLVLPPAELRLKPNYPAWDASSIAATLWQVRPPPEEVSRLCDMSGGCVGDPTPDGGALLTFPELEDVELAVETKLGNPSLPLRRFSIVGIRLWHVVAVVAQPANEDGDSGDDDSGDSPPPAGSISLVRSLLRPSLVPMSSLFYYLSCWAPQEELASHRLLARLLD
ncbi:hypothetical protein Vretifemale_9930 [Volvox reticuliferus]|uniref:Uncharacterized protein n=2 Tax=Volvox reticuliferus TaxID=1737510 RepID=A0A8J4CIJ1_9CHLO|nr:hypothetical protein Vretifemale_9930 [Volvox reticuliferus]